jgi:hypothetical protein
MVVMLYPMLPPQLQQAHAAGATYYVSSSSGNDSNPGTQAAP